MQRLPRNQTVRWITAMTVFWTAGIVLLFSPSRLEYPAPVYIVHLSQVFDSLLMAMVFYSSLGLILGKRAAWRIAVAILFISVVWETIEAEATFSLMSLVPLAALIVVTATRRYYPLKSESSGIVLALRRALLFTALSTIIACFGFFVVAWREHRSFSLLPSILESLNHMYNLSTILEPLRQHTFSHALGRIMLFILGLTNYLLVASALAKPVIDRFYLTASSHQRAWRLLRHYAHDSEDYFKFWPEDKSYYFGKTTQGFIAYGVHQNICVALADPIAADPQALLTEFDIFCKEHGWLPAFVPVSESNRTQYKNNGYETIKIGEGAVVNLSTFMATTLMTKNLRNITNRFERNGFKARFLTKPYDFNSLQAISDEWLAAGKQERRFVMGFYDPSYLENCRLFGLYDSSNSLIAWVNLQPSFSTTVASFDLMRSSTTAPPNSMDYLFIQLMTALRQEGFTYINFGLVPLAGLDTTRPAERNLHFIYMYANQWFAFKGLRRFKDKFQPDWQPYYLMYKGNSSHLPAIALALSSLMKSKSN